VFCVNNFLVASCRIERLLMRGLYTFATLPIVWLFAGIVGGAKDCPLKLCAFLPLASASSAPLRCRMFLEKWGGLFPCLSYAFHRPLLNA